MPKPWMTWLGGGSFAIEIEIIRPAETVQRAGRLLDSTDKSVVKAPRKLQNARNAVSKAERDLQGVRALNAAGLHWKMTEQLLEIMQGLFAMGPAWTLMRAASGFQPQDSAAIGKMAQSQTFKVIQNTRIRDTEMILASLDLWCGDSKYEDALRFVIKRVAQEFQPQDEARVQSGVKRRPLKEVRISMRPTDELEVGAVLGRLPLD